MTADRFEWIDAAGVAWQLTDGTDGIFELPGRKGAHMPPIRRSRERLAGQHGTRLQTLDYDTRTVELVALVRASDEDAFESLVDDWLDRFDPTRGDGQLRHVRRDGSVRVLSCRYVDGLTIDEQRGVRLAGNVSTVLVFEADDPLWYDEAVQSQRFVIGGGSRPLFPFFPIVLSPSQVLGDVTLDVDTDVAVFPEWTITGPGSAIELTNAVTGDALEWAGTLIAGDELVIDPAEATVLLNGASAFSDLTAWDFWQLQPGSNSLTVAMAGATPASSVTVRWRAARLGA